jgi:hypothetical protein
MKNFKKDQLSGKELQKLKGGNKMYKYLCESTEGYWTGTNCIWPK